MHGLRMVVIAAALFLVACGAGRFVGRGMQAYEFGDYPLALENWQFIEREGVALNEAGEVRFLVYKGLTLVHMGKKEEGKAYLLKGRAAYQAGNPKWLKPEIVTEMEETLAQMGAQ
jgi:hypothetical protein